MQLSEAIEIASERQLGVAEISALVTAYGESERDSLNRLAMEVARSYMAGRLSFLAADTLVNGLNAYCVTKLLEFPEPMQSIYLAFDAGEYVHKGDREGTNSELKYTRPQLQSILVHEGTS